MTPTTPAPVGKAMDDIRGIVAALDPEGKIKVSRTEASPQSTSEGKKASSASKKSKQSQKPSAKAAKPKRSANQSSLPKKARGNGGTQETNPQA